jgi:hypothetical protein
MFLVSDVFSYLFFIKAYCTDTVAACPECTSPYHSATFGSKTHDLRGTLAFQKTNGMSYRILGWYRNTKVNMVGHRMPFNDFYALDSSPLFDRVYDNLSLFPIQFFAPILGDPNDMVLTIPN